MKRLLSVFCLSTLLFSSCNKEGEGFASHEWTLEKEISVNMAYFTSQNDASDTYFYEAECVLNGKLAGLAAEDVKIKSCLTVANVGEYCHQVSTDFNTGIRHTDIIPGAWGGSFAINDPTALKITFKQAVEIIKNAKDFQTPNSDKMTLRHPLGVAKNPLYIFGSSSEGLYVSVDAMTGEVSYF